ncbi:LysM peptidoglycan-binding domain-containing protein [Brevibacillus gelatini]|uniref:LysM peptidoglycan-binding domain-containing protein n=1 Tax=Brevibacillus gelatini TaxID=1655277 RepID=A0A3M8B5M4_9BACL|nr:LysM peptidoglycan-binding domain-containing protein [Brevibacillus gelatini]RNB58620.1 LysM peptidoglycan-binding domain-containing protein [Brevibacillus gelatini]
MNLETNQLPPRRSRHTRKKASVGMKTWVRSGLLVFGVVFFGLIGLELYKANLEREKAETVRMSMATQETSEAKPSAAGAETAAPEPEPKSVVLHTTSAEPAQTAEQAQPAVAPASAARASASSAPASTSASEAPKTQSKPVQAKTEGALTAPATQVSKQKPTPSAQKPKVVKHVVKKGETLYMLSRKYFGNNSNVSRIARYNGFHPETQLVEGKVVFVPLAP